MKIDSDEICSPEENLGWELRFVQIVVLVVLRTL